MPHVLDEPFPAFVEREPVGDALSGRFIVHFRGGKCLRKHWLADQKRNETFGNTVGNRLGGLCAGCGLNALLGRKMAPCMVEPDLADVRGILCVTVHHQKDRCFALRPKQDVMPVQTDGSLCCDPDLRRDVDAGIDPRRFDRACCVRLQNAQTVGLLHVRGVFDLKNVRHPWTFDDERKCFPSRICIWKGTLRQFHEILLFACEDPPIPVLKGGCVGKPGSKLTQNVRVETFPPLRNARVDLHF